MVQITSTLIKDTEIIDIKANNVVDTYSGSNKRAAFVVANGDVGDDKIIGFGKTDSLITGKKIFDGNEDGLIGFGKNGLLDIYRVDARKAGNDQLSITNGGIRSANFAIWLNFPASMPMLLPEHCMNSGKHP